MKSFFYWLHDRWWYRLKIDTKGFVNLYNHSSMYSLLNCYFYRLPCINTKVFCNHPPSLLLLQLHSIFLFPVRVASDSTCAIKFTIIFFIIVLCFNFKLYLMSSLLYWHFNKQCRSYFMFHEMDANSVECIFKYLPLLSFTESYIYQVS